MKRKSFLFSLSIFILFSSCVCYADKVLEQKLKELKASLEKKEKDFAKAWIENLKKVFKSVFDKTPDQMLSDLQIYLSAKKKIEYNRFMLNKMEKTPLIYPTEKKDQEADPKKAARNIMANTLIEMYLEKHLTDKKKVVEYRDKLKKSLPSKGYNINKIDFLMEDEKPEDAFKYIFQIEPGKRDKDSIDRFLGDLDIVRKLRPSYKKYILEVMNRVQRRLISYPFPGLYEDDMKSEEFKKKSKKYQKEANDLVKKRKRLLFWKDKAEIVKKLVENKDFSQKYVGDLAKKARTSLANEIIDKYAREHLKAKNARKRYINTLRNRLKRSGYDIQHIAFILKGSEDEKDEVRKAEKKRRFKQLYNLAPGEVLKFSQLKSEEEYENKEHKEFLYNQMAKKEYGTAKDQDAARGMLVSALVKNFAEKKDATFDIIKKFYDKVDLAQKKIDSKDDQKKEFGFMQKVKSAVKDVVREKAKKIEKDKAEKEKIRDDKYYKKLIITIDEDIKTKKQKMDDAKNKKLDPEKLREEKERLEEKLDKIEEYMLEVRKYKEEKERKKKFKELYEKFEEIEKQPTRAKRKEKEYDLGYRGLKKEFKMLTSGYPEKDLEGRDFYKKLKMLTDKEYKKKLDLINKEKDSLEEATQGSGKDPSKSIIKALGREIEQLEKSKAIAEEKDKGLNDEIDKRNKELEDINKFLKDAGKS